MKRIRAVLVAPKQFDFVQEEIPKLKENEVLYKTISVGLCHSDIPAYRGTSAMGFGNKHGYDAMIKNPQFPMGIGHEPVCVVEDVGSAVTCFRPGDLVTGVLSTCIADYNVAANAQMIKIPETSKPIDACLGEPMMCVANIVRAVEPKMGDRVAVIGCGFMGLMVIAGLKSRALGDIVAIDLDEKRLEMAVQYGATKTINPKNVDVEDVSFELTHGRMYDCIVEITGSLRGLQTALSVAKISGRGKILAPSVYSKNETWTEEMAYNMMYRSPIIHVVHPYYTNEYMHTLEIGVEAYVKGVFPTEELITHRIPFERVDEGFRLLDTNPPGYIKGIITF